CFSSLRRPLAIPFSPYTTLFRSTASADSSALLKSSGTTVEDLRQDMNEALAELTARLNELRNQRNQVAVDGVMYVRWNDDLAEKDRKSTRLNSSHVESSYAVFRV